MEEVSRENSVGLSQEQEFYMKICSKNSVVYDASTHFRRHIIQLLLKDHAYDLSPPPRGNAIKKQALVATSSDEEAQELVSYLQLMTHFQVDLVKTNEESNKTNSQVLVVTREEMKTCSFTSLTKMYNFALVIIDNSAASFPFDKSHERQNEMFRDEVHFVTFVSNTTEDARANFNNHFPDCLILSGDMQFDIYNNDDEDALEFTETKVTDELLELKVKRDDLEDERLSKFNWSRALPSSIKEDKQECDVVKELAGLNTFEENHLGYKFTDQGLLLRALTHKSYKTNSRVTDSFRPLDFVGDTLLKHCLAQYLFGNIYQRENGILSDRKACMESNQYFAYKAVQLNMHKFAKIQASDFMTKIEEYVKSVNGKSYEEVLKLNLKGPKFLADIFEALAAAVYYDSRLSERETWKYFYVILREELEQSIKKDFFCGL